MRSRDLAHELRTAINHIVGYSDLLIEDLAADPGAASYRAIGVVRAAGREMLAAVNEQLGRAAGPDAIVSPDVLARLRSAIRHGLEQLDDQRLHQSELARAQGSAGDIAKILGASDRLLQFARTGRLTERGPAQS